MIQKFNEFINEGKNNLTLTLPIFKKYVLAEDELDDIEEYFDLCAEKAFSIANSLNLIDKDDIQKHKGKIDYGATMNDILSFMGKDDKEKIIKKFK